MLLPGLPNGASLCSMPKNWLSNISISDWCAEPGATVTAKPAQNRRTACAHGERAQQLSCCRFAPWQVIEKPMVCSALATVACCRNMKYSKGHVNEMNWSLHQSTPPVQPVVDVCVPALDGNFDLFKQSWCYRTQGPRCCSNEGRRPWSFRPLCLCQPPACSSKPGETNERELALLRACAATSKNRRGPPGLQIRVQGTGCTPQRHPVLLEGGGEGKGKA